MKKLFIYILSIFSVVAFYSCDDREDIRNDINDLISRLDKLQPELDKLNAYVANYQDLLNGQILILGYSVNEETGDYVLDLSNGERMIVYSGKPSEPLPVVSIGEDGFWYYTMNGEETKPLVDSEGNQVSSKPENGMTPEFRINSEGMWEYRFDGGEWTGGIGMADPSLVDFSYSLFDEVVVNGSETLTLKWKNNGETMECNIPLYGGLSLTIERNILETDPEEFHLNETRIFDIEQVGVENIAIETIGWKIKIDDDLLTIQAPSTNNRNEAYTENIIIKIFSKEGYCRLVTMPVKLLTTEMFNGAAEAWNKFVNKSADNVLLDFSYAGYMHGSVAPPDVNNLTGYTTVNIKEYKEQNGIESDRVALNSILYDYKLVRKCPGKEDNSNSNSNAKLVVYFPEGEYVLQDGLEDTAFPEIYGGNFVIKGAGTALTKIKMTGLNDNLKAPLLNIKHTNSPTNVSNSPLLATVNDNATKGDFTVKVDNTAGITSGKWVQLRLRSGNPELITSELGGITPGNDWSINTQPAEVTSGNEDTNGVRIMEFHQVKSVGNGTVTFEEPIMHDINIAYNDCGGWQIREYKYFENVGIEDLTFEGNCITPYYHHGPSGENRPEEWVYDEGYVPLQLNRVVNSWVRNVNFVSVSEAVTFGESANCSAYNIQITGNRGHSAVRAQGSSRVFIGKVMDSSSDDRGNGQWHGCGVSKPSIGTVIWNSTWGIDACFESHASQPRATLFDNCSGGLVKYHAGGNETENPNHLAGLTLWNLNVTGTTDEKGQNFATDFNWWSNGDIWWKIYPPIVVGVHGQSVTFADPDTQMTYCEGLGTVVTPESLYEAQLYKRLGYVPTWLNSLK